MKSTLNRALFVFALIPIVSGCSSTSQSNIEYESTIREYLEDVVACDNGSKNFTINPEDLDKSDFFQGEGSSILRIHYAKSINWTGLYVKDSGITREGSTLGYVDIERISTPNFYYFKSNSEKKYWVWNQCHNLKKWSVSNGRGSIVPVY